MKLTTDNLPDATPLAIDEDTGEAYFITENPRASISIAPDYDAVYHYPEMKRYTPTERRRVVARLKQCVLKKTKPEYDIIDIYDKMIKQAGTRVEGGSYFLLPNKKTEREVVYVSGMSGSGKSTFIRKYAELWQELFPEGKILLVSQKEEDPTLDELDPERIMIDEILDEEGQLFIDYTSAPEGSLWIFDDTDALSKKELTAVNLLKKNLLNLGRQRRQYVITSNHKGADGHTSKHDLSESHILVVFPHGSSAKDLRYVLEAYTTLDREERNAVIKAKSRWVAIRKMWPAGVVQQNCAYILGNHE